MSVSHRIRCMGLYGVVFLPAVAGLTRFYLTLVQNVGAQPLCVFCIANSCPGRHLMCALFSSTYEQMRVLHSPNALYMLKRITTFHWAGIAASHPVLFQVF